MTEPAKPLRLSRNLISEAGIGIAVVALANLGVSHLSRCHAREFEPLHGDPDVDRRAGHPHLRLPDLLRRDADRAPAAAPPRTRRDRRNIRRSISIERRTRVILVSTAVGLILFVTMSRRRQLSGLSLHRLRRLLRNGLPSGHASRIHGVPSCRRMRASAAPDAISDRARAGSCARSSRAPISSIRSSSTNTRGRSPVPVENLRPAQETCEQCHWPEKFFGAQLKVFNHYAYDETNTPKEVRMLIKTGGGSPHGGQTSGIHWHMNIANEVTVHRHRPAAPGDSVGARQRPQWQGDRVQGRGLEADRRADRHRAEAAHGLRRLPQPPDAHLSLARPRRRHARCSAEKSTARLPFIKQQAVAVLSADYPTTDADLINLVPGVAGDQAYGGTKLSNGLYIDGLDTTEASEQNPWLRFNQNWLHEVQVVGLGAEAEYGLSTGVTAAAIVKSGTNQFAGLGELWTIAESLGGQEHTEALATAAAAIHVGTG